MDPQTRWAKEAWLPFVAGLAWILASVEEGSGWTRALPLLGLLPGVLLLAAGTAGLIFPGDRRYRHAGALGAVLGVLLAVPSLFVVGPGDGLLLGGLSAAAFLAIGALTMRQETRPEGLPAAGRSLGLAAQVATDCALLGFMDQTLPLPGPEAYDGYADELEQAVRLYEENGWLEKPADYHVAPPPPVAPVLRSRSAAGVAFEHLSFESGYAPHPDEPGRTRWMGYAPNRTAHAWILRHEGEPRPWLVAIHGYQMGAPRIDLRAFQAARLHRELGLNVALPVLPLHGPRKVGRMSGDGFLTENFLDTVHAEGQAMWDLRRLLAWIRGEGGERIGVYGLSLGGYNASLLACLDPGLERVLAGIPATDIPRLVVRHGPPLHLSYAEHRGLDRDLAERVVRVVSPLVLEPRLPKDRLAIFGGLEDQLVPADQVYDLWKHWDEPRVVWFAGAHLTFPVHADVRALIEGELRALAS